MSKSFQLLQTFTEKEFINFQQLLDSGYLSNNPRLSKLLKILKKKVEVYKNFTPTLQHSLFETIYGKDEEFDSKKFNKLVNDLLKAAEKFLMFEKIKNTDEHHATLLFPELINRKQIPLYSSRVKAAEKKLSNEKKRGVIFYNQCSKIQQEKARLLFISNALMKEDNYDALQYHTDVKYLIQKLQYHLAKITLKRSYGKKTFNFKPFHALQPLLNMEEYQSNTMIKLYILNIQLIEDDEATTFVALSKLLKERKEEIPDNFLNIFYVNLTNYCVHQVFKGILNYYNYLFTIYNDMHEGELLVINNTIELALLKNIITTACRVKAFDWAFNILNYYKKYIPVKFKDAVFHYHSGIILFNQQKFDEATHHFSIVSKIDDIHELNFRIVWLQCLYEADLYYENETKQIIESFKTYLQQNKKMTSQQKVACKNFIRIYDKLYLFKFLKNKDISTNKISNLDYFLSKSKYIREKKWLSDKIKNFEN